MANAVDYLLPDGAKHTLINSDLKFDFDFSKRVLLVILS